MLHVCTAAVNYCKKQHCHYNVSLALSDINQLQLSLSNMDTEGTEQSERIREVSVL